MKEKTPKEKSSVRAFLCRIRNIYDDSEVQRQFDEVPATALIRYKGDSGGEANEIARLRDTVKIALDISLGIHLYFTMQ